MELLTFLILLESLVLSINIVVSILLYITNRTHLYKLALFFWSSLTLQFFVMGLSQHLSKNIFYEAFFGNGVILFLTNILMLQTIQYLTETHSNYRRYLLVGAMGLILGAVSYLKFNADFVVYSSIIMIFICGSAIYVVIKAMIKSKERQMLKITLGVLFIAIQLHYLDYPFLRTIEWFAPYGFTISIALHVSFAIVLPSTLIKKISDDHQEKLEFLVNERTLELKKTSEQLLTASRQAGMSEIVTGTLHNVGNVLNSVNISVGIIDRYLNKPITSKLEDVRLLINRSVFDKSKMEKVSQYLNELLKLYDADNNRAKKEAASLRLNVDDIKNIISVQQSMAGFKGLIEKISIKDLINDTMSVMQVSLNRHGVKIDVVHKDQIVFETDRLKTMQILINVLTNAKNALIETQHKKIVLETSCSNSNVFIIVRDNGKGITVNDLTRIFNYGFTTNESGHGYGLHHSALSAQELGGELKAYSDGKNLGASFELILPIKFSEKEKNQAA